MNKVGLKIEQLLEHSDVQFQKWHWQTKSYAEHMTFGAFYDGIKTLKDTFMESYMGQHGRVIGGEYTLKFVDYSKGVAVKYLKSMKSKLSEIKPKFENCGDLQNIIDEMTALVTKTLYLLTLK